VTSESQETLGPSEELHLLYIDPFFLDRRNFDPDQLLPGTSNNPSHGQDPDVGAPSATASAPESQTHFEDTYHSLTLTPPPSRNSSHSFILQSQNHPQASHHAPAGTLTSAGTVFTCPSCLQTFPKRYLLNRHSESHTRDFKCSVPGCPDRGSRYHKDLVRHMRSRHPEVEGFSGFLCPVAGCSRSVGRAFFRKDNYQRHMTTQHPHAPELSNA